jgi:hypothetical protein
MSQVLKDKKVTVKVRTPAGAGHEFTFSSEELVADAVAESIGYFVGKKELAQGDYGLAVVRDGTTVELQDTARIGDYDLHDGEELHLVPEAPQIDG